MQSCKLYCYSPLSPSRAALPVDPPPRSPPSPTFTFKVGAQARINCTQRLGTLISQYFITWRNSSSNEILADIPNPQVSFQSFADVLNPRHRVDPTTFALLIDNVTLQDSASTYQCELGVVNVQTGSATFYRYRRSKNLQLLVYSKLQILQSINLRNFLVVGSVCTIKIAPLNILVHYSQKLILLLVQNITEYAHALLWKNLSFPCS